MRDVFRQRYSVTWHPRLLYLIVSDGYMATVMRVPGQPSPALMLKALLKDVTQDLEKASRMLDNSQVLNGEVVKVESVMLFSYRFRCWQYSFLTFIIFRFM